MKRTVLFCGIVLVVFGLFVATAMAQAPNNSSLGEPEKLAGGIVYFDGEDIIYCELARLRTISLTPDLKPGSVKGPVSISADGEWLAWRDISKIWVRQLPKGTPYAIQYENKKTSGNINSRKGAVSLPGGSMPFTLKGDDVQKIALSPDGARISIEAFYGKKPDTNAGIFYLSTIYNESDPSSSFDIYEPRFGNLAEGDVPCASVGGATYFNRNVKKAARFLTFNSPKLWKAGKKLAYFIYQTGPNSYGPIEIRLLKNDINTAYTEDYRPGRAHFAFHEGDVVKAWEIPVSLHSCEGLAIKPDGSLTVLSEGNIYIVDWSEIEKGMAKSSVVPVPSGVQDHSTADYANNVFSVKSYALDKGPVAKNLMAHCLQWISNDTFICLNQFNMVGVWQNGKAKKLLDPIPGDFAYTPVSPFETQAAMGRGTGRAEVRETQNHDLVGAYQSVSIKAGYIRTNWGGNFRDTVGGVFVGRVGHQKPLDFCLTDETDFNKVDLSACKWQKAGQSASRPGSAGGLIKNTAENDISVPLKSIFVLRDGDNCSMIKPLKLERRWQTWDEAPQFIKGNWRGPRPQVPPYNGWLVYEWESRVMDSKSAPAKIAQKIVYNVNAPERKVTGEDADAKEQLKNKWCQLYEAHANIKFTIGGMPGFSWDSIHDNHALFFWTENEPMIGIAQEAHEGGDDIHLESIDDPSVFFKKPFPDRPLSKDHWGSSYPADKREVVFVRYSKLEGKYFGVELVRTVSGRVIYKKRYWPDKGSDTARVATRQP